MSILNPVFPVGNIVIFLFGNYLKDDVILQAVYELSVRYRAFNPMDMYLVHRSGLKTPSFNHVIFSIVTLC